MRFTDREDAGRQLAAALRPLRPLRPVVFGIPRGGVVTAAPVARTLGAPLLPALVRKAVAPDHPELAIGAVGPGLTYVNRSLCAALGLDDDAVEASLAAARAELADRLRRWGLPRAPSGEDPRGSVAAGGGTSERDQPLVGRDAILVDDGIATGATAEIALRALRSGAPRRLILAVPVGPPSVIAALREQVDDCVCLHQPDPFVAVGAHYARFDPVSDDEVADLLRLLGPAVPGRP